MSAGKCIATLLAWVSITLVYAQNRDKTIQQAELALSQKEYATALELAERYLKLTPLDAHGYFIRGQAERQLNKPQQALRDLRLACDLNPQQPEFLFTLATLAFELDALPTAKQAFHRLLKMPSPETNLLFYRNNSGQGIDRLFTTSNGIADQAYHYLGLIALHFKKVDSATLFFDSAIRINSKATEYKISKALALIQSGKTPEARQVLESIDQADANYARARHTLSALHGSAPAVAEKMLREATLANPNSFTYYYDLALVLMNQNKPSRALPYLDSAIRLNKTDGELYLTRALAKEKLMHLKDALADTQIALKIDDTWSRAWLIQANILAKLNQLDAALENYTVALHYDPTLLNAHHNRGMVYLRQQNFKAACLDFKTAEKLGLKPDARAKLKACGTN